jgi:hypothetical protein
MRRGRRDIGALFILEKGRYHNDCCCKRSDLQGCRGRAKKLLMQTPVALPTPFADIGLTSFHIHLSLEMTGIAIVLIALAALVYGGRQLTEMQKTTRAAVLLSLDERWENEPMLACRTNLEEMIIEVRVEAAKRWRGQSESEIRRRSGDLYAERLAVMADENRQKYMQLLRICGFFETVGCVVQSGYIPTEDVLDLLRVSIRMAGVVFEPHIKKLLEDGAPSDFFENFLWLVEEAQREHDR